MAALVSIGTYLPPWEKSGRRVKGFDEDALTMAVAAGRAADPDGSATRVVLVSRDFPLLEGGNGAVLLAALSLDASLPVVEILGGGPSALDEVITAPEGSLIIAADDNEESVGAVAVLIGTGGATLDAAGRRTGSLPLRVRGLDGIRHSYTDPRLQREVGVKGTLAQLGLDSGADLAGVSGAPAKALGIDLKTAGALEEQASSAAAALRVLAAAVENGRTGVVLAVEQASAAAGDLNPGSGVRVIRDEVDARERPATKFTEGNGIPISLPAYSRAFESKIRWEAAVYEQADGIDPSPMIPPRLKVDDAGRLLDYTLEPLPRSGTVYTFTTIRIPVPDLPSPYSLAVVQLDGSPVRVLLKVTGVAAGETEIGQSGSVVLRKVATRAGIPDYGYAFWPGKQGVTA